MASSRRKTPPPLSAFESPPLSASILSNRHALVPGAGVSLYYDLQRPHRSIEQVHASAHIVVGVKPARGTLSWRSSTGEEASRSFDHDDVMMIPPDVCYRRTWRTEAPVILLFMSPDWLRQFRYAPIDGVVGRSLRLLILKDPLIGALVNELGRIGLPLRNENRGPAWAVGQCLAARIVAALSVADTPSVPVVRRLNNETMDRITRHVQEHLAEKLSVRDLAREARFSPSHFSVLFKATTGMTSEQFILRTRLARAKTLIESGAYTVGQVAHLTGFADHSHLTIRFTTFFGAPPKAFLPVVRTG